MLKILHFYKTYYPDSFGGIEQIIFQLSEGGIPLKIESTILTISTRGNLDNKRVGKHIAFYAACNFKVASTPFSISAINKFKALSKNADIIHYHFPYPFMDLLHFITGIKKPTLVSYHSDIIKQKIALKIYTPLMNKFLNSVNCIVVASPNYVNTSQVLQKYLPKIKIIPYGLDKKSYPIADKNHLKNWQSRLGERFFYLLVHSVITKVYIYCLKQCNTLNFH